MSAACAELEKLAVGAGAGECEPTISINSSNNEKRPANEDKDKLYWYFGYGSNLNNETFLVRRGIKPLAQSRMIVPGWYLNFQIAGVPYLEPGFGSIDRLASSDDPVKEGKRGVTLQGMAYLVTEGDYRHIIATEGGNSSYRQLQVTAVDPLTEERHEVWTLQAIRPRKACQPSVRYITIIREGAREHGFPQDYIDYLDSIEPFVLRGKRQKLGALIFTSFWMPIIAWLFALRTLLTRPDGSAPAWLTTFAEIVFTTMWSIHDDYWAKEFGRGDHNAPRKPRDIDEKV